MPTFPLLIWRDVGESKHHSESLKLLSSNFFGEDVYDLLISGTMVKMDCFGLNMTSNQMICCIYVLCSIMELWVLGKLYCRGIFNHDWSKMYLFYLQIFQNFPNRHNLSFCLSCCHIFCLYCGIYSNWLFAWSLGDNSWSKTHSITKSRYPSLFVSIEVWIRVSNQVEVTHVCILECKVLSSIQVL